MIRRKQLLKDNKTEMNAKSTILVLLCNVAFRLVFARSGMLGDETDAELPPLKLQGVVRVPEDGVITYDEVEEGTEIECKLPKVDTGSESKNGKDKIVKDTEWKWVRLEINDENEDTEIPLEGEVKSTLDADYLKDTADELKGWIRLKCSSGDNFAEFRIDAGNTTKSARLPFRVKRFEKSKVVVEKEDFTVFCEIVNRTELEEGESIQEGLERLKKDLNVRWYRWDEAEDQSYIQLDKEGKPIVNNCTE